MSDPFHISLRNEITNIFNEEVDDIYYINLDFFFELEKALVFNKELNDLIRQFIRNNPFITTVKLYENTMPNEKTALAPNQLFKAIENYNSQELGDDQKPLELYIPIHRIFYRLYVKGGSAIKSHIEYIFFERHADDSLVVPPEIGNPTDIDSCMVINPAMPAEYKVIFEPVLTAALENSIEETMVLFNGRYRIAQWWMVETLNKNVRIINEISNYYRRPTKFARSDSEPLSMEPSGRANYTKKLESNALKLFKQIMNYKPNSPDNLTLYRVLLDIKIEDERDKKVKLEPTSAEIIDVSYYQITNPEAHKAWKWGCHAVPLVNNLSLFMGFDDLIADLDILIRLQDRTSISKKAKREERKRFLLFCYCVYKMFRDHFETSETVEMKKIYKYCLPYALTQLENITLPIDKKMEILPFLIQRLDKQPLQEIIIDTIKTLISHQSHKGLRFADEKTLEKYHIVHQISAQEKTELIHKINEVLRNLNETKQAEFLSFIVGAYFKGLEYGNITFLLYLSIIAEPISNPQNFAGRCVDRFLTMKNSVYAENIRTLNLVIPFSKALLNGLNHYFKDIPMNLLLKIKSTPYSLVIEQAITDIKFLTAELIVAKINEVFGKSTNLVVQFISEPEFGMDVSVKMPVNRQINGKIYEGEVHLKIVKISWGTFPKPQVPDILSNLGNKYLIVEKQVKKKK